jgi:hypothetical protein
MACNLKIIGIVIAALFACSAMTVSAAGGPFWFESDADPGVFTDLNGELDPGASDVWTVDAGEISCTNISYSGRMEDNTETTMTLTPSYGGCTFHGLPATIDVNGCAFVLHTWLVIKEGTPGGEYEAGTVIECPVGKDITVTQISGGVKKCTIHIEPQNLGEGLILTNAGEAGAQTEDITADVDYENIKYTQTEGSGAGKCVTTTTTPNGSWVGKETFKGTNLIGLQTNIWVR